MKILDILTAPWAIEPAKLLEIQAVYATHLRGEKIDIAAVEKELGRALNNEAQGYAIRDGVAIIPMEGVIAKKANLFSKISGGVSTELAARDLRDAMNDPAVHSIILSIDSPGGTVDGTQALADIVSASTKPIVTLADGTMASAAYWIGSAANSAYIADSTTIVGSIGVVATHTDISKAQEREGVKTTEIFAGQYKRIASNYAPLSKEGRQTMQDQVDYTYSLFVSAVASNRGVSTDTVLADMADGRIFIGQQAIDAGLVDGVITLDALVAQLNSGAPQSIKTMTKGNTVDVKAENKVITPLTAETIAAEYPEIAAGFRAQGAADERDRIAAIEAQLIPGHEALIGKLKFDGTSNAGDAAQAVLAAEKSSRQAAAKSMADEAPAPVAYVAAPFASADQFENLPLDERCQAKWDSDPAIRAEFRSLAAYKGYETAMAAGRVKQLSGRA
ncbi:S49 family peptidase [Candidatus Nitrotoga sp. M5]|uniref:S49 family peptidase n=1 Tax=Candidatus Nitrotoga sp. M5 TaxID=2890409 RepID=UPI001EF73349|nr:S49 family peptidase [Candidatus Nitrotoga sp. M5]CAH1387029.1 ClpP class periplasmic serine protease [Candidatus Nitrotoga sp. M5]